MQFTDTQILIIKLLKTYKPLTLASISEKLGFPKSSLLYQLEPLVEQKILIKEIISTKKITYKLATKEEIEDLIEKEKMDLELLLTNKEIKGLDAYKELLNMVANGDSDVIGYANLEKKITPEFQNFLEKFRDKFSRSGRVDRFSVPDYDYNIVLLRDHFRKLEWKKALLGKIISKKELDINCDIYVWDGTVGICNFENGGFNITIYTDKINFEVYKRVLTILWERAKELT
jgi:hypothetical protein